METTLVGYLKLEKNKEFLSETATIGTNEIQNITISLVLDELKKIHNIIATYNDPDKPIEYHYSLPITFEKSPAGLECHVKGIIRAHKSDSLMKLIDWSSKLLKTPLQNWIGSEIALTVKLNKYDFGVLPSTSDAISGGAREKRRGVSFQIKSIKLASEIPKK